MPKTSAGLLLFRRETGTIELLLAHPGGPFWARKDEGAWTVPKGEVEPGEEFLGAARREFTEEMGRAPPAGEPLSLGAFTQPSRKVVWIFAQEGEFDAADIVSASFEMEWPPKSGRTERFPEVDRAEWFDVATARRKLLRGQAPIVDALLEAIGE